MPPKAWKRDGPATAVASDEQSLANLLEHVTRTLDKQERVDIEQLTRLHPQHADRLRELVPTMQAMAGWGQRPNTNIAGKGRPPGEVRLSGVLGDFRIHRELGRGGMGTVYEAEQISLGRQVALKVLPFAALVQAKALQRFRNEVRAVAALDHPHVVSVYSVGEERGIHYYSMQLIRGQSLAEMIWQNRQAHVLVRQPATPVDRSNHIANSSGSVDSTIDSQLISDTSTHRDEQARRSTTVDAKQDAARFRSAARLGVEAADALQHAHEQGVLHRDIKPGNLLLDSESKLYVTDFGLARIEADAGMTMTGDIVGTLRYMAPEQALGERVVIDQRADIYSLGATLYELLALEPAFNGDSRRELLNQIAFGEPAQLQRINRRIPVELETIVHKAMAKSPEERYQTAGQLGEDLRAFLGHRPIKAKPPTLLSRASKWSRRHIGVVWTAVAASLLLSAVLATATTLIAESRQAAVADRERAKEQRNIAVVERNDARLQQYYAEIVSGGADLADGNLSRLQQKLVRHLPVGDESDHRGWEWYYLFSQCHREVRTLNSPRGMLFASWSPDGRNIATAGQVWRADTGKCVRLFTPSLNMLHSSAWSPDSQVLAWSVTASDSAIYLWDRRTDEIRDLRDQSSSVYSVPFHPNGMQLASGANDDTVNIWDLETDKVLRSFDCKDGVTDVAWSPDGKLLAAGIRHHRLYVWDAVTGNELLRRNVHGGLARIRLSWRPDGSQLAVNSSTHWYVLNCQNWNYVVERAHRIEAALNSGGNDVEWSPSGDQLAIANGTVVSIWDPASEKINSTLAGHSEPVNSVSWSPDSKRLVTTDGRREIRIWDAMSPSQPSVIETSSNIIQMNWNSHDGTLSTVAAENLTTSTWQTIDGSLVDKTSPIIKTNEDSGDLSPNRRLRAHWSGGKLLKSITVSDTQSGTVHAMWRPTDSFEPLRFAWSPDGGKLAIVIRSATHLGLECWDVTKEQRVSRWTKARFHLTSGEFTLPTWSPSGELVAMVGRGDLGDNGNPIWSSHIHVIDVAAGKRTMKRMFGNRPRYGGQIESLAWAPDGQLLAQGTTEGLVEIIEIGLHAEAIQCKAHDASIRALAWSSNGKRLATAAADGRVKVIETGRGNELLTLTVTDGSGSLVSWSPNGKQLAAASDKGLVRIWDATRGFDFADGGNRRAELAWPYYDRASTAPHLSRAAHLRQALALAPKALDYRLLRGHALARLGEFDAAAREFAAATPESIKNGLWTARWQARALLGARNIDSYRKLQASLEDAVRDSVVKSKRFEVAWLGALLPGQSVGFESVVEQLTALKEKDPQLHDEGLNDRQTLQLGAMLSRLGKYEEAQTTLAGLTAKLRLSTDTEGQYVLACSEYFHALTRHQMGHAFQARRRLVAADRIAERLADMNDKWHWHVEFATLRREATLLIGAIE